MFFLVYPGHKKEYLLSALCKMESTVQFVQVALFFTIAVFNSISGSLLFPGLHFGGTGATSASSPTLMLNTRANPTVPDAIPTNNPGSVSASHFAAGKPVKILIPGYLDTYAGPLWVQMVNELLQAEDCNVLRLDYSAGNSVYAVASANAASVATGVATVVQHLVANYRVNPQNVHVIGHSLGAQVAGQVGKAAQRSSLRLGRITGLDPAGPGFTNTPAANRLDSSDAGFVDTIMTDSTRLGTPQAVGHVNFVPNGGQVQPGCSLYGGMSDICSHLRALRLFIDSINPKVCSMTAYQCSSYNTYAQGGCNGQRAATLGYRADASAAAGGAGQMFYLRTGESESLIEMITACLNKITQVNVASKVKSYLSKVPLPCNPARINTTLDHNILVQPDEH